MHGYVGMLVSYWQSRQALGSFLDLWHMHTHIHTDDSYTQIPKQMCYPNYSPPRLWGSSSKMASSASESLVGMIAPMYENIRLNLDLF